MQVVCQFNGPWGLCFTITSSIAKGPVNCSSSGSMLEYVPQIHWLNPNFGHHKFKSFQVMHSASYYCPASSLWPVVRCYRHPAHSTQQSWWYGSTANPQGCTKHACDSAVFRPPYCDMVLEILVVLWWAFCVLNVVTH